MCVNTLDSAESDQNNKENYISDSDTSDKTHKSNETEVNSSSDDENEEVPLMKYLWQRDLVTQSQTECLNSHESF